MAGDNIMVTWFTRLSAAAGLCFVTSHSVAGAIVIDRAAFSPGGETHSLSIDQIAAFYDVGASTVVTFEGEAGSASGGSSHVAPMDIGMSLQHRGLHFGAGDRLMGGLPGFGYLSEFTVVGNSSAGSAGDAGNIDFRFVDPTTGLAVSHEVVGFIVADGPTNEQQFSFFDASDALLGSFAWAAQTTATSGFAGWQDTSGAGIARVSITTNGAVDDHYIDDITYGRAALAVPEPAAHWLWLAGLAVLLRSKRARRST